MTIDYARQQFQRAASSLGRRPVTAQRLGDAFASALASLLLDDIPKDLQPEFQALMRDAKKAGPDGPKGSFHNTVDQLTAAEREALADRVVALAKKMG